jgi:hypothetical protein
MPTDGQTNLKKPIDAFRNFAKALKNSGRNTKNKLYINISVVNTAHELGPEKKICICADCNV